MVYNVYYSITISTKLASMQSFKITDWCLYAQASTDAIVYKEMSFCVLPYIHHYSKMASIHILTVCGFDIHRQTDMCTILY